MPGEFIESMVCVSFHFNHQLDDDKLLGVRLLAIFLVFFSLKRLHEVSGAISIAMCIFETSSALLTTFRSIQALRACGSLRTQKQSFLYMILEEGVFS